MILPTMFSAVCTAAKMASTASTSEAVEDKNAERRKQVMLGPLPGDFLSLSAGGSSQEQQEAADRQAALALQQQLAPAGYQHALPTPGPPVGRLSVTLAQAKLVKNYGLTRMDPYVRLRVGHCIYESHTDPNGGKNPRWNKIINCLLPTGINTIFLEIYDECSFTTDELIAWANISVPPAVMQGETHEDWYPLSGKQGDGMEGMINLVFSYTTTMPTMVMLPQNMMSPVGMHMMSGQPLTVYQRTAAPGMVPGLVPGVIQQAPVAPVPLQQPPPPVPLTEEELKTIQEMFPSIDKEVIKSVSEANRGDKDATITSLLQMSE